MPHVADLAKSLAKMPISIDDLAPDITNGMGIGTQPLFSSLLMIIISEIGDKTFLVAALMAMKHDRVVVFFAAFTALLIMSILSGLLGHTMPSILPRALTQSAACCLFLAFGLKMCRDGYLMDKDASVQEEMAEIEIELEVRGHQNNIRNAEEGHTDLAYNVVEGRATFMTKRIWNGVNNLSRLVFSPIFVKTFSLTFLGEWGDRSQIATIAMAAGSDYWSVIVGTVLGHGICTAVAVVGGRLLAQRISVRQVTLSGGLLFLLFGALYLFEVLRPDASKGIDDQ